MGKYDSWVALIGILVTIAAATGFFLQPDIRPQACPDYIDSVFVVSLTNYGKSNADAWVNITSSLVISDKKQYLVIANPDKETQFEFNINKAELQQTSANLTIRYEYGYYRFHIFDIYILPKTYGVSCNYNYESDFPLKLISS
ncbi:MAG: hypothetical protein HY438_03220 [DPANN group archaeon]|nr:hypothetical protein [DPANN group archaeon]